MYSVQLTRKAEKELNAIRQPLRRRIIEKLRQLAANAADPNLDVKALKGGDGYRLRVGEFRIIYTRDDAIRIIAVLRVVDRRDAYR